MNGTMDKLNSKYSDTKNKKLNNARELCAKIKELADQYGLPVFAVTDGASICSNNGNAAIKNARDAHIEWEKENGFSPKHDWSKGITK